MIVRCNHYVIVKNYNSDRLNSNYMENIMDGKLLGLIQQIQ